MSFIKAFRALGFVIGSALLLDSIMTFLGLSFFLETNETNETGAIGAALLGIYFIFYALTGTVDVFSYFQKNKSK